jgi:hypothetical protein
MKLKITLLVASALLLSACTKPALPNKKTDNVKPNVFTSIKDAVTKQLTLKCIYNDDGQLTTTYIKGNQVRFSGSGKEANVEGLMKDGKFHLWNSLEKKGMTLEIAKMTGAKMGDAPITSVDDVITQLEAKKESCTVSPESNSMFELPTDVNFTDTLDFSGPTKQ